MKEMLVFGYVGDATSAPHERMVAFAVLLAKEIDYEIVICKARSYSELTELVQHKKVDLAWLPPLSFIALERFGLVLPIATMHRGSHSGFFSVVVVANDSKIPNPRALRGMRAAWVDPHSASGYVLPRIGLQALGVDPRSAFRAEKFWGSHEAVVRAVIEERADFGGTYAGLDSARDIVRAAWLELPGAEDAVRVLATFGAIPTDVVAARSGLDGKPREAITSGLEALSKDALNHPLLHEVFGVDSFVRWAPSAAYDGFKKATMDASSQGLLEGEEREG